MHELAHAAVFAMVRPNQDDSNFYVGSCKTVEDGYESQAWLFGGVVPDYGFFVRSPYVSEASGTASRIQSMLTLLQYPCPAKSSNYDAFGYDLKTRGGEIGLVLRWNAPFPHVNQFFQDDFWQGEYKRLGRRALFFEKSTGYFFDPETNAAVLPHPSETQDVPKDYWVDRNGLVRKRVDKESKIKQSASREVHLAIAIQKESAGVKWERNPENVPTLRDYAGALYNRVSSRIEKDVDSAWKVVDRIKKRQWRSLGWNRLGKVICNGIFLGHIWNVCNDRRGRSFT